MCCGVDHLVASDPCRAAVPSAWPSCLAHAALMHPQCTCKPSGVQDTHSSHQHTSRQHSSAAPSGSCACAARERGLLLAEAHIMLHHMHTRGSLKQYNTPASLLCQGRQLLPHPPQPSECPKPTEHAHSHMDEKIHSWLLQWWLLHPNTNPTPAVVPAPMALLSPLPSASEQDCS